MVMTNSTWTQNHIESLFGKSSLISVLYPPCDTEALSSFPFQPRKPLIVSLAQFRPEKNHRLQIEAFSRLLERNPEYRMPPASDPVSTVATPGDLGDPEYPQLVIIGGARDSEDKARAAELRRLARDLKLDRQVHVIVNAPYSAIKQWLAVALVGIHTMVDEHFGISIVEFLSAGLVTIANSSAGPLMDIVIPANRVSPETGLCVKQQDAVGFLASDAG
ncbi:asparagine-linked glycosylation protein, partial [Spiromyces aspiralis]